MKKIEFKSKIAQRIYNDYLKRVEKSTKILSLKDEQEMLLEINSHIFEGMSRFIENDEADSLLIVLENLGEPEEFLKPLVARKKVDQAVYTFNPKYVYQAIKLNLKNGIVYSIFGLLYLFLFIFILLILAKLIFPSNTGLFYLNNELQAFGFISNPENFNEVLGFWFIPIVLACAMIFYISITLLLRLTRRK